MDELWLAFVRRQPRTAILTTAICNCKCSETKKRQRFLDSLAVGVGDTGNLYSSDCIVINLHI